MRMQTTVTATPSRAFLETLEAEHVYLTHLLTEIDYELVLSENIMMKAEMHKFQVSI